MDVHAFPSDATAAGASLPPAAFDSPVEQAPPAPWHHDAEARAIREAIAELGNIAARLEEIDHRHRFLGLADAAATVGRLLRCEQRAGMGEAWQNVLRPSNGTSAVGQLWDQLAAIRRGWIEARLATDGHDFPLQRAESWHAWDALDAATPEVGELP